MSKLLNVSDSLELLGNLRGTFREFADAEERTNREFRNSSEATEKKYQAQIIALQNDLESKLKQAQISFSAAKEHLENKYQQRSQRIARAHATSKRKALDRIDAEEGRRKYRVQKGMLDTEKWRDESLSQNDSTLAAFQAQIAAETAALQAVRDNAARAFRGHR